MPRLFSSSVKKSLVSSAVMVGLGVPFTEFQTRLYGENNVKGMTHAVETLSELCGRTLSDEQLSGFESFYRKINIPLLYIPFFLSSIISYQHDADKYYAGEVSPIIQWVKAHSLYKYLSLIGSVYKSMIQILSLYDFNQRLFQIALESLANWINIEMNETTLLATSCGLSFGFAVIAFVGVMISTYGFFSSRQADIDGTVRFCGYEVGKKTVNSAVSFYTLTNLVLYAKNMIPPLEALWKSDYSYFAPILGILTIPFLIPYTWFNFKVYQKKVEQKLLKPSEDQDEEELNSYGNLKKDYSEPVQVEPWCIPKKRKFLVGALMATSFKAAAQGFQTIEDSFFNFTFGLMLALGFASAALVFFYFFSFCQGAWNTEKEPDREVIQPLRLN